jgi:hypothetical protein
MKPAPQIFDVYTLDGNRWVSADTYIALPEECTYTKIINILKEHVEVIESTAYTVKDEDGIELIVSDIDNRQKFKLIRNEAIESDLYNHE